MKRLALDHLTAVDATPIRLAEAARSAGCDAFCLFVASMDVLPMMPEFDLCSDPAARRELRGRMADMGVALDIAYPFTLSGRNSIADMKPGMECAADLGAGLVNLLVYDRDSARRIDRCSQFCDMAASFGLQVALEFYPPSQVPSLAAAIELVEAIGRPGALGVNVDLLHLMRSGDGIDELAAAPPGSIVYAQLCDGPVEPPADPVFEASSDRRIAGEGGFDLAGFVRALPDSCPLSVEIPRNAAVATESIDERVGKAVASARRAIGACSV